MTKRTKVVTRKVAIRDRANPTTEGLDRLANNDQRLIAAVKPHLVDSFDRASFAMVEPDESTEPVESLDNALVGFGQGLTT